MIELYYISLLVLISTLVYTSILDSKYRRIPFYNWYPLMIVGSISTIVYIYYNFNAFDLMTNIILITTVIIFYLCAKFKIMGGADAWVLIFITIFSISIPFNSILNNAYTGVGVSTYINTLIISAIIYPIYNYITNVCNGVTRAPIYYMFFSQRINGIDIDKKFGYIIDNNVFYYTFKEFIEYYKSTPKLFYTKLFMTEPDKYKVELEYYKQRSHVWIVNAVPFIVYITLGFLITIIFGDIYNFIIGVL